MSVVVQETQQDEGALAEVAAPCPCLFVVFEVHRPLARGARFSLRGVDEVLVGRGAARAVTRSAGGRVAHVTVPSPWMSSRHARLLRTAAGWVVEDVGSRNGTFVEGVRVDRQSLPEGALVEAGQTFFLLGEGAAPGDDADEDAEGRGPSFGLRTLSPRGARDLSTLLCIARGSAASVLLVGPTGSGKDLLARAVHDRSLRPGPFVAVNCGALPPTGADSMLFGHVRGAGPGGAEDDGGFVRASHGGTLFLDEVADLPPRLQGALLRTLQEGEIVPVGSSRPVAVDLRVVAATHRPLEALVASGAFRADLFARLRGYTHRVPPLAARREDLGLLFADIVEDVAGPGAGRVRLTVEAARALLRHPWPLNVRELRQRIVAGLALTQGGPLELCHLQDLALPPPRAVAPPPPAPVPSAVVTPRDLRLREDLLRHLSAHHGNVAAVARAMGKAPAQVHRWMKRFAVDVNHYRDA